jgi:hypothetical protein
MQGGYSLFNPNASVKHKMPRSLLSNNVYRALAVSLAFVVLLLFAGLDAGAQKRRGQPQPGVPGATVSATPQKKSITPLRVVDTPEGSRVTITSDAPLNDYSAYRSGNRFFLVIPQADNVPRLLSTLRGRGFDDVQVQKRGVDVIISFRLQPGVTARVDQKFNRLEIVFTAPGTTSAGTTRIDIKPPLIPPGNTNTVNQNITGNQNGSIAPPTNDNATTAAVTPAGGRRGGRRNRGSGYGGYEVNEYPDIPVATDDATTQTETATPSPGASVTPSPGTSPSVAPSGTPVEQIAQTQTAPPPPQTAVTTTSNQPAPESRTLGATLKQNWLLVLLAALVLLIIGWVLTTRSRGGRRESAATATATTAIKEKSALKDAPATRAEAAVSPAAAAAVVAPVVAAAAVEKSSATKRTAATDEEEVESKQLAPVADVDVERANAQINNLLVGEKYDEAVVGTSDAGTRQLIAAGLLAALAGRNEERRERAREAFIKHDYFDEATRDLRTADASAERASAARSLGLARDVAATPHLVAALEDSSPEVRRAAVEALADLRDPEALAPLRSLLEREKDRKVPRGLIRRAIEASTPAEVVEQETPTLESEPVVAEAVVAPPVEVPVSVEAEEDTAETVRPPSVETAEAPSVETAVQPGALDTVPEPETIETGASPVAAADLSSAETTSDPGTLAAATPLALAGAAGLAEMAARRRAEKEEERRRAEEEAKARAEEEDARRKRAEEERRLAEEEATARKRAEEEEARRRAEEEARQRAEEERQRAEEEARRRAEEERQRAEAEARRKAEEEEARKRAEEEARIRAEEEARRQAEEEARRRAEEEAARKRAEEEARQRAEEEARLKAEEEARVRAEEERRRVEEERRRAEEEAARKRAEEEARQRAEEERKQAEAEARRAEEARLRAEEEARQREAEATARRRAEEEEARRRAEEERLRAEEEAARQRLEAEAASRRAEEEAERQRGDAELARLRAEAEATRLRSEEELGQRQVIQPDVAASLVDPGAVKEIAPSETASYDVAPESLIERNDGTSAGWVEVDISEPEIVRHATPIRQSPAAPVEEEKSIAAVSPEPIMAEAMAPESLAPEVVEQPRAASPTKEIDAAISDKGIAPVGEDLSTVPSAILKRLSSEDDNERATAVADLGRLGGDDSFREITSAFDDPSQGVRDAAARSLYNLQADRAASFTRALREAPPERRRAIGAALASSGLANEAIGHLMGESREKTYDAFSLLFLMSKAGEVQPLLRAIEDHPNNEVRLAVVKLLALSGQQEILPAFRRLAVRGSLPTEVRSAVMEAIYQISSQSSPDASSAA